MGKFAFFKSKKSVDLYSACSFVLNTAKVRYTKLNLQDLLEAHIDYPSLLAIKDTLSTYGIESAAIRKENYDYSDFETPFICSVQQEGWGQSYFTVVTANDDGRIRYIDPIKNCELLISQDDFNKIDKDVVLLLDAQDSKDEIDFDNNRKKEKIAEKTKLMPFVYFTCIWLFAIVYGVIEFSFSLSGIGITFFIFNTFGLLISALLVWHDIDAHNPFLKEVCGGGKSKLSCEGVLKSKGASFFGFSWSILGFVYFGTLLASQFLFGLANLAYMPYWHLSSLLVAPYVFYSIYYQWRVVRQWCLLCVAVQVIIILSGSLSLVYLIETRLPAMSIYPMFIMISMGFFIFGLIHFIIPLLKTAKESKEYEKRWKRLHYHPAIFEMLLRQETSVSYKTEGLGLLIGNPKAKHEIIKVCNPYCGPCSKAHPELDELVKLNPDVKVRMIFTATGNDDDLKTPPVRHLLAIQEQLGQQVTSDALNAWYKADKKDYTIFAEKYPSMGEPKLQTAKIEDMRRWCDDMKIRSTPTFYINGFELPNSYQIGELKYIL